MLQTKTQQILRSGRDLGLKSYPIPNKSFPIGICVLGNIFLSGVLQCMVLREKGRIVTSC